MFKIIFTIISAFMVSQAPEHLEIISLYRDPIIAVLLALVIGPWVANQFD